MLWSFLDPTPKCRGKRRRNLYAGVPALRCQLHIWQKQSNMKLYNWLIQAFWRFSGLVLGSPYITHTHKPVITALYPGLPRWAGTRKVKPIWILLKQETVSGSDISWAICKSASRSRQITMPVPHHSSFLQAGCPSCRPTNSVKALKAKIVWDSVCKLAYVLRYS